MRISDITLSRKEKRKCLYGNPVDRMMNNLWKTEIFQTKWAINRMQRQWLVSHLFSMKLFTT
jgi:hypothetical protein